MSDDALALHELFDRLKVDVLALGDRIDKAIAKAREHRTLKPKSDPASPQRKSPPWRGGIPPWVNLNVITNADPFSGTGKSPATGPQPTDDGS